MPTARRVLPFALLVAVALAPASARAQGAEETTEPRDQVVLYGDVLVRRGEEVGEVVVLRGRVFVAGVVRGDVIVLSGRVDVMLEPAAGIVTEVPIVPGVSIAVMGVLVPSPTGWRLRPRSSADVVITLPSPTIAQFRNLPLGTLVSLEGTALTGTTNFNDGTLHLADGSGSVRATGVPGSFIFAGDGVRIIGSVAALNGQPILVSSSVDPFLLGKGERKRLAVASFLALEPAILILDEPTTGLDYPETRRMMELLARLHEQGTTLIVITHHPWVVAEYARRGVLLSSGRILFEGSLRDLFADPDLLEQSHFRVPDVTQLGRRLGFVPLTVEEFLAATEA